MTILYIGTIVVGLLVIMQLNMLRMAKKSKGIQLSGLTGKMRILEKKGSKGLVYFFSPGCHACKAQTPVIKLLQSEYKNIYDVDISQDSETAQIFGIKATPTTVLVEDGIIRKVLLGTKTKEVLESLILKLNN
jgi:thiol-disulfide isomerase/thioredoxin